MVQTPGRDDLRVTRAHWNGMLSVVFEDEDHFAAVNYQLAPGEIGNTVRSQQTLGDRLVVEHIRRSSEDETGRQFRILRQRTRSGIALTMLERQNRSCSNQPADAVRAAVASLPIRWETLTADRESNPDHREPTQRTAPTNEASNERRALIIAAGARTNDGEIPELPTGCSGRSSG